MTVLVAYPPWAWDDSLPGERGLAEKARPLTAEQISLTPLPTRMQPDSVLFLWRPASRLSDALYVAARWGFTPKTELVWLKRTANGARAFGMGHVLRGEHETCLVCTMGRPGAPSSRSVRSTFEAYAPSMELPDEFYELVHELYPSHTLYDRVTQRWDQGWLRHTTSKHSVRPPSTPSTRPPARA